ncbi:MAG: glycoside hydrolase family 140 protein [Verrucomicrobiia bacterium]
MKTTPLITLLSSLFVLYGQLLAADGTSPTFPLQISENRRHLVDQKGVPFLYQADTPWMLFVKLSEAEAKEYIARRKEQGFTALQVMLTGFLGMTNRAGELPFAGTPPEQDFARPNEKFFAHVDLVVAEARRQGMLLAIAPAWSGCCGEGWAGKEKDDRPKPLNANGVAKSRDLGRWLGLRYGKFDHVLWILGGDIDPDNAREEIRGLGHGIKEAAPQHLITYHASSSHSSTDIWPADEPWLDVSMVYTYFRGFNKAWNKNQPDVYEVSHAEFAKTPLRPFFLGESTYEGEHGAWGSALQARKQAYWCVLGGGCGHAYGSPNWNFPANWRQVLEQPGALSLKHLRSLLESRPWWKLVPDAQNVVAVGGRGSIATNNYAVTAIADDASFAIAYLPTRRTLTLDMAKLSGDTLKGWWFNPRDGKVTVIGKFPNTGEREFTPPDLAEQLDWVLVLDNAARNYPQAGEK